MLRMKGGEIQFNNEGLFTVRSQTKEMFSVFDFALDYVKLKERKLTDTAQLLKKDFVSIPSETGKIKIPVLTSGTIKLSERKLDGNLVSELMSTQKRFEFADSRRFEFSSKQKGADSFHWVATAMDKEKDSIFGICSNENEISLIPHTKECTFESFLEFYRHVLEKVDDKAALKTFGG